MITIEDVKTALRLFRFAQLIDYNHSGDCCDWRVITHRRKHIVYLFFQDSNGLRDWINNFTWFPVLHKPYKEQTSPMLVHKGFSRVYKSCNDEIMENFISELKAHTDYKPVIVGWSFGGAMAQLAAEDFYYRTGLEASIVTFGAPKIFFGKKTYNYVKRVMDAQCYCHVSDIVTKCVPVYGFRRVNTIPIGYDGWKFWRLFNPWNYHCCYDKIYSYFSLLK